MRTKPASCHEAPVWVNGVGVVACDECSTVEWWSGSERLSPDEGMARLFGRFELTGTLPGLRTPGPTVLVYRPPTRRHVQRLRPFPLGRWLEASEGLWMTHDGSALLLSPTNPIITSNLTRR